MYLPKFGLSIMNFCKFIPSKVKDPTNFSNFLLYYMIDNFDRASGFFFPFLDFLSTILQWKFHCTNLFSPKEAISAHSNSYVVLLTIILYALYPFFMVIFSPLTLGFLFIDFPLIKGFFLGAPASSAGAPLILWLFRARGREKEKSAFWALWVA